ncbi:glycine cleavage system H protein [Spizellomyces punctatus DAOM BR117]|uniref:Glycine cleavage system H protein n=1 Tax=Spizellomyces punctatus (strain DAOM BR117) TaxID=645134 RepID=A0A0L0HET8_SPIPD|nr:glycine cleavage system H protein [Spizellomyces punctatus DAOM BR117]KNC99587.1 glycine cleavage system H protein [Spizellomyces punctatus DAOM BR117]|eukprot:XP_016607627.1 glycine cleavage system H protein [Spizellomyces punctatus DAOM BR117]
MFRQTLSSTRVLARSFRPQLIQRTAFLSLRGYATRKYTPEHEWVSVDANGVGTVGITEYAAKALGDVVFVEIPEVGTPVLQKEQLSAVESVKAASDVYAPLSGEVIEVNQELESEPSLINSSPFEKGWIAKIKLTKKEELDGLLDEAAYAEHIKE